MNEANILIVILSALITMLLFAFAVIWFLNQTQKKITVSKIKQQEMEIRFQEEMLINTVKTAEEERDRISKELHDDVTSKLNIVHLNLHLLKQKIHGNSEMQDLMEHIESSLKASVERARAISHELTPPLFKKFGFHHSLIELANTINISQNLELTITGENLLHITDDLKLLHLYRIIQELLNNTIKYSEAKNVSISFQKDNFNTISMFYKDDGKGFEVEKSTNGLGMNNIKTRIRLLGGTMQLLSESGKGMLASFKFSNHE